MCERNVLVTYIYVFLGSLFATFFFFCCEFQCHVITEEHKRSPVSDLAILLRLAETLRSQVKSPARTSIIEVLVETCHKRKSGLVRNSPQGHQNGTSTAPRKALAIPTTPSAVTFPLPLWQQLNTTSFARSLKLSTSDIVSLFLGSWMSVLDSKREQFFLFISFLLQVIIFPQSHPLQFYCFNPKRRVGILLSLQSRRTQDKIEGLQTSYKQFSRFMVD